MLNLVPEQIAGLIEKVELDQTVGQPANDLVAAAADRGELLEIEIERERIDAREGIAFSREEQVLEEAPRIFVQRAREVVVREDPLARRAAMKASRQRPAPA